MVWQPLPPALADQAIPDQYPGSLLYATPVEVIPHVWSAIGATAPPTYENAGHNNNLSFIVTGEGVIVVNGGASAGLAGALHDEIKAITDEPVVLVINENGQGHAALGNTTGWGRAFPFWRMKMRRRRSRKTAMTASTVTSAS